MKRLSPSGSSRGRPYEVAVEHITKIVVAPTDPVGHGAQRGALWAGGVVSVAFFPFSGPCAPLLFAPPFGALGSAVGAAVGTTSFYDREYLIDANNWRLLRDEGPPRSGSQSEPLP